jgi:hypothetical protein
MRGMRNSHLRPVVRVLHASATRCAPPRAHERRRRRRRRRRRSPPGAPAAAAWRRPSAQRGCWTSPAAPSRRRPRAVVHFLGGAFAAPLESYGGLVEQLADAAGATVTAVPCPVSFKHELAARSTHAAFLSARARRAAGRTRDCVGGAAGRAPRGRPQSQGALLHALAGAICAPTTRAASALISSNNKAVGDAVPLPLGPAGAAVDALRAALGGAPLAARAAGAAGAAPAARAAPRALAGRRRLRRARRWRGRL